MTKGSSVGNRRETGLKPRLKCPPPLNERVIISIHLTSATRVVDGTPSGDLTVKTQNRRRRRPRRTLTVGNGVFSNFFIYSWRQPMTVVYRSSSTPNCARNPTIAVSVPRPRQLTSSQPAKSSRRKFRTRRDTFNSR